MEAPVPSPTNATYASSNRSSSPPQLVHHHPPRLVYRKETGQTRVHVRDRQRPSVDIVHHPRILLRTRLIRHTVRLFVEDARNSPARLRQVQQPHHDELPTSENIRVLPSRAAGGTLRALNLAHLSRHTSPLIPFRIPTTSVRSHPSRVLANDRITPHG